MNSDSRSAFADSNRSYLGGAAPQELPTTSFHTMDRWDDPEADDKNGLHGDEQHRDEDP
jgi:hypothetical protein